MNVTVIDMLRTFRWALLVTGAGLGLIATACGKRPADEKCTDPPASAAPAAEAKKAAAADDKPIPVKRDLRNVMWCRSCVVGPAGYMSCKTVRPNAASESNDALRERARVEACVDSGFTKDNCPGSNVISLMCKGDPEPKDKTAAGKAMLDALRGSGPVVLTKDGKTVPNIMYDKKAGPGAPEPSAATKDSAKKDEKSVDTAAPRPHIE